jgi:uncharacterized membrane protein
MDTSSPTAAFEFNDAPPARIAEALETARALDPAVDKLTDIVETALPPGRPRDVLRGGPLGHPLHPIAVLVPAGAWISASVLDFVPGQEKAAQTLIGVGVLGALPAAAAGVADWSALGREQKRVGIVHWASNLTAVGLFTASYLQRRRGHVTSGKVLSLLGLGIVSAAGYLGGHLTYRQAANVTTNIAPPIEHE